MSSNDMSKLENLFGSLSKEQQQSFVAYHSSSSASSPVAMGIEHVAATQVDSGNNDNSQSPVPTGTARLTAARRRQILNEGKKKKPLNAFMAFRSYYSPILRELPQKVKSGLIQKMWSQEPRKPFFTLLGQAYSEIRDSNPITCAEKDFLKKFLRAAVSLLPVIPAEDYLDAMGWVRGVNQDGEVSVERSEIRSSLPDISVSTNCSVRDIIDHCYATGLLPRPAPSAASLGRNAGGAMAFAAAPSLVPRELWPSVETPLVDDQPMASASAAEETSAEYAFDFSRLSTNYRPTIVQVTADQQQAFDQMPMPMHFHPGIQPPVLGFDPNMIQDEFDPYSFDVDQYLNLDFEI